MSVAIETVNTVVDAAMQTVNRMSAVTLEQLQAAHAQQQLQARLIRLPEPPSLDQDVQLIVANQNLILLRKAPTGFNAEASED